jgi:hypothetical protein
VVLDEVLRKESSDRLAVYAVWEPILRSDDERAARRATTLLPDPRVRHFWAPTQSVGELFQSPIGLVTEPAWDVYLLYAPGTHWSATTPPKPDAFLHQLRGRLPEDRILNGERMLADVQSLLSK